MVRIAQFACDFSVKQREKILQAPSEMRADYSDIGIQFSGASLLPI